MKKRELAILVSSTFIAFSGAEAIAGGAASTADSWGITCDTALIDAYSKACRTCYTHQSSCGDTLDWSCDDGFFYSTAHITIECDNS